MWFSLPSMRERWGDEAALAVARAAERRGRRGSATSASEQGVDAWFRHGRLPAGLDRRRPRRRLGAAARRLPRARRRRRGRSRSAPSEVAARCASPAFRGGAFYPTSATVQPARLALGLRERLLARGVEIYESLAGARAARRRRRGRGAHRAAARSAPRAAVLAIGGAAKGRRGPLRSRLTVASSHIVLTEPVPELLEEIGWTGGECITDCRALLALLPHHPGRPHRLRLGRRPDRDGRAAARPRRARPPTVVAATAAHLHAYFPGLAGRRITHAWGGPIDASPTHLPLVMPLRRRPRLRRRRLHRQRRRPLATWSAAPSPPSPSTAATSHSRLAFVDPSPPRVPPEPFHWIGGEAIRAGIMAKEEAEMAGRRPEPVASAVARVPELIGFHIGR